MVLTRRHAIAFALTLSLSSLVQAEELRTVRITVKNLVCPRCASKITKSLLAEAGVERVDSSVPEQRFTVALRGAGPSDARLKELVEHDGVTLVAIVRE